MARDYLVQLFTNSTISASTSSTAYDQLTTPGSPPRGNRWTVNFGSVVNANATLAKNITLVFQGSTESLFTNTTLVTETFLYVFASASTTTPISVIARFYNPYEWVRAQVLPDSGITASGVNIALTS